MSLLKNTTRFSLTLLYFSFIRRRKISDRIIYNVALSIFLASSLFSILILNDSYTTSVPTSGGTLVEGIVGTPRFVNPVLAINRADHDMVALIYSGLLKLDAQGNLVNDIAESITQSEDGKTYHIQIRNDAYFHNGQQLKVRDIAYTIALIQDPELKSPLRGNWDGVQIEEIGEFELNIILEEAYMPFIENLLVGILPRELWDGLSIEQVAFSQNNTQPIGTGPYQVTEVVRNKSGLINGYKLSAFTSQGDTPNISKLVFNFYQNEEELLVALSNKEIASTPSLSPENLALVDTASYQIIESPIPRTFAMYFNQNKSAVLRDKSARNALEIMVDRDQIITQVLRGHGIPTDSPVPPGFIEVNSSDSKEVQALSVEKKTIAEKILIDGGWRKNEVGIWEKVLDGEKTTLSLLITTANTPLFDKTATAVADMWKALGIEVTVSQFEQTDLVQTIIRPRDFEILLYGADIGRQIDLYPFWHSSQKNDPGLNIAQYTNIDVDALLEKIRITDDATEKTKIIHDIENILEKDIPAVFLFVPTFGYVLDAQVRLPTQLHISRQSERFAGIRTWHMESDDVWPMFSDNQ